jgi:hypothetical protein
MIPDTKNETPQRVGALAPLFGVLTRAGTFPIYDEETTGLVISMTREDIKAIFRLPMYERVVVQPAALVEDWTVRASDYDRLAAAARELRAACKHKLTPGHYAQMQAECDALDALLSPNAKAQPDAQNL